MKKLFALIVAVMTFASSAMALDYIPEEGVSVQALFGMNLSNLQNTNMNPKVGMNLGIKVEYMLPECYGTYVNIAALYTMKGARQTLSTANTLTRRRCVDTSGARQTLSTANPEAPEAITIMRPCYLEIPIHIGYRYNLTEDMGIYADFGPYLALGINGKTRHRLGEYGVQDIEPYFNWSRQRFDAGLGLRIGCEYIDTHSITLSADWGLSDVMKDEWHRQQIADGLAHPKVRNLNISLTYGYRF